ncbi:hypothetical protein AGRA3207_006419 [Actinomadura graeca]|uniref:Uncharacterized protein n=1 Tax=Actinomadura graeca TaxID=2750812 RepID=A0ABX8R1Q2_9ACTN|nr:hypothetical protein [Actinomadura graeca]QXJ24989.1 hypothetical protein AGRA3207_006419 [Actinomadura graeca]
MSTNGGRMNALPYLASLAGRLPHRYPGARHEYARLHADIVEARLAARARDSERIAHRFGRARSGGAR